MKVGLVVLFFFNKHRLFFPLQAYIDGFSRKMRRTGLRENKVKKNLGDSNIQVLLVVADSLVTAFFRLSELGRDAGSGYIVNEVVLI